VIAAKLRQLASYATRGRGSVRGMDESQRSMVVRPGLRGAEAAAVLRFGLGEASDASSDRVADTGTLVAGPEFEHIAIPQSDPGARAVATGSITLAVLLAAAVGFPNSGKDPPYGGRGAGFVDGPKAVAADGSAAARAGVTQQETAQMSISRNSVRATVVAGAALIAASAGAQTAVQWRVSDGGNGHWYQRNGQVLSWAAARQFAVARGGDLATLTTKAESNFAFEVDGRIGNCWLGGFQVAGACEPTCEWAWVTGEAWVFSAWRPGQPDNTSGTEESLCFWGGEAVWNDGTGSVAAPSVIEWSADCNNDGIVDFGQILNGSILDANTDGVPDCCEGSTACAVLRLVPSQYATIQSAIDAAQPGDRVLVSAGTYREQVNLNGKRISLEGVAGSASTIIDGEGIRTNIVGSGEPDGCVVSGFTIQNGSGYDAGGVLLSNSAARIHHCVFRNNSASSPWGGAGFRSAAGTSLVEDCVFTNNFAQNQSTSAGWYHIFGGSFALRRCTFDGNTSNASGVAGGESGGVVAKVNPEFSEVTGLIEDCVFMAQVTGDPTPSNWGPIHVHASRGEPVLVRGCTFVAPPGGQTFAVLSGTGSRVAADRCTGCGFNDSVYAEPGSTGTVTKCDFSPTCADCNHNSVADLQEIVRGDVVDTNANRIPDVCEIPGCRDVDLFRDGAVNGADLGILLIQWGVANANTVSDINHDGRVDGSDLAALLAFWGPCLN